MRCEGGTKAPVSHTTGEKKVPASPSTLVKKERWKRKKTGGWESKTTLMPYKRKELDGREKRKNALRKNSRQGGSRSQINQT